MTRSVRVCAFFGWEAFLSVLSGCWSFFFAMSDVGNEVVMPAAGNVVIVRPPGGLEDILERVSAVRDQKAGLPDAIWVEAVYGKLNDVEVFSVRAFVEAALTVNRRLHNRGFKQLHYSTLKMMLRAACDVIFESGRRLGNLDEDDSADATMPMDFARAEDAAAQAGLLNRDDVDESP